MIYLKTLINLLGEFLDDNCTWLLSCISHTMKRFANSIKALGIIGSLHSYACFCFSLLANCTCLELAGKYYKSICRIFLYPFINSTVIESKTTIKAAVNLRPSDLNKLLKILERYKLDVQTLNTDYQKATHPLNKDDENNDAEKQ